MGGMDLFWGGHGPLMQVCENERIGSNRGCAMENFVCRSANGNDNILVESQEDLSNQWFYQQIHFTTVEIESTRYIAQNQDVMLN